MFKIQQKYDLRQFPGFILLIIVALLFSNFLSAQNPAVNHSRQIGLPHIQNFTPEDYGAGQQNHYITQDPQGLIYVANDQGVLQYDGSTWRLIPLTNGSTAYSLVSGADGVTYVGGEGEIGYLAPDENGDLQYVSLVEKIPARYRDFNYGWQIVATSRHIFFATDKYFFRWQTDGTDKQMEAWVAKNIYHNCFALNDEIYVWEWEAGLEQLIDNSLQVVPGGEAFIYSTIRLMAPFSNSANGKIFIGTVQHGLYTFDGVKAEPIEAAPVVQKFLKENSLYNSIQLNDGTFALATTRGGIAIVDEAGNMIQLINSSTGLQDEATFHVFQDQQGGLWVALYDGISRIEIPSPYTFFSDELGLTDVTQGVIHYQDGFYAYGPAGFFQLTEPSLQDYRTRFQIVRGPLSDSQILRMLSIGGDLIAAAHSGVFKITLDGSVDNFIYSPANLLQPSRFHRDLIYAGLGKGIGIIQKTAQGWELKGYLQGITEPVRSIEEASSDRLWVTTAENVLRIRVNHENFAREDISLKSDSTKKITTTVEKFDQSNGLPEQTSYVHTVNGNTIFATSAGFRKFDPRTNTFVPDFSLGYTDTTRNVQALSIQPNGDIWFISSSSTDAELIQLKPSPDDSYRQRTQNFQHLLSKGARVFAIDSDPSDPDIAWISTSFGLVKYTPAVNKDYGQVFPAWVRKVLINSDSLIFGGTPLNKQLPELAHASNAIRFEYAAPSFDGPEETRYQVWLEGFDTKWSEWTAEIKKDYTNLPAGDYNFRVRARNIHGTQSEEGNFAFSILPPWYGTWWAYLTYLLLLAGGIYGLFRWRIHRLRQHNLALEALISERTREVEEQKEQLEELNQLKSRFFTNISHEFRSPLTIIEGTVKHIEMSPDQWLEKGLRMIRRSNANLLNLVNQILDLRKLETGGLKLNVVQSDIISYLRYIIESFHSLAEQKRITLHLVSEELEVLMDYDKEKMLRIISNLLSNAIKFSPEGNNVYLMVDIIPPGSPTPTGLEIKVRDTGSGISETELPHIFDRFYQADDTTSRRSEGTGIGLSLTKALVELMNGTIKVESLPGKGTTFSVFLPVSRTAPVEAPTEKTDKAISGMLDAHMPDETTTVGQPAEVLPVNSDKPVLLIVEDNMDVVEYLESFLGDQYRLYIAHDGKEGIETAINKIPDLILSDVMMPEKDGFEVCKTLKADDRTSHIPIVLLTAKADIDSRIIGLERGADAYVSKPFNEKELVVRLEKLFDLRKVLQERYRTFDQMVPSGDVGIQQEDTFITKLRDIVEKNLLNEEFGISELCHLIGMSRSQLHLKIKALTNRSTSHFIRLIRLQKAKELLQKSDLNITEIAYDVGFQDPAYFSRTFTEEFGISPREFGTH